MTPQRDSEQPGPPASTPIANDWEGIEQAPEFRELVDAKRGFIFPATIFFIIYYFALPVLVGYWPEAMGRDVIGEINVAYLFALSQFAMAWIIMVMYVRRARVFDGMVERLLAGRRGGAR